MFCSSFKNEASAEPSEFIVSIQKFSVFIAKGKIGKIFSLSIQSDLVKHSFQPSVETEVGGLGSNISAPSTFLFSLVCFFFLILLVAWLP